MTDAHDFYIDLKLPLDHRLHFGDDYNPLNAWRLLSRNISRTPHNLRLHTQRILLCIEANLEKVLLGAFQDLSIALSLSGKRFYFNLLDKAKDSLSAGNYTKLSNLFENTETVNCWLNGSVLSNGICTSKALVIHHKKEIVQAGYDNNLEEALALIDEGQIDEARIILEQALLDNFDDILIEEELLLIYQSTRDKEALENMTQRLLEAEATPSLAWEAYMNTSEEW
ncbi:MAG: hypothetical protein KAH22_10880 [Thiotrichaceae bacterium]|nr:hypothetical protein [Thiotrichaceae bacterium]